jgi:uncharacterized delta-60 repeat protein
VSGVAAVAIQSGSPVVAGTVDVGPVVVPALLRLTRGGLPDPTFGNGGIALLPVPSGISSDVIVDQADQVLVITFGHDDDGFLFRVEGDGTLDGTFGTDGVVPAPVPGAPVSLVKQPDGAIVIAGIFARPGGEHFALARYLHNGVPDVSFGVDGRIDDPIGTAAAVAYADDRIVVAGWSSGVATQVAVARYLATGEPARPCDVEADCDDGNPCTLDRCGPSRPVCRYIPYPGGSCDSDGNECTEGFCGLDGSCIESIVVDVPCRDDGDPCTVDRCAATGPMTVTCVHRTEVDSACAEPLLPRAATLAIVEPTRTTRCGRVRFHWSNGSVGKAFLGNPFTTTSVQFCAFVPWVDPPLVVVRGRIDPASTCTDAGCWTEWGRGWRFRSRTGGTDGVRRLIFNEGATTGMARVLLKLSGPGLSLPPLPIPSSDLRAELRASTGQCLGTFIRAMKSGPTSWVGRAP